MDTNEHTVWYVAVAEDSGEHPQAVGGLELAEGWAIGDELDVSILERGSVSHHQQQLEFSDLVEQLASLQRGRRHMQHPWGQWLLYHSGW